MFYSSDASIYTVSEYVAIQIPRTVQTYANYIPCIEIMAQIVEIDTVNNLVYTDYNSPFNFDGFTYTSSHRLYKSIR